MSTVLLRIDCAPGDRSITRLLADEFLQACHGRGAGWRVVHRDLGRHPVPHVSPDFVAALGVPAHQHTPAMIAAAAAGRELAVEFVAASHCLLAMPMRILTVPLQFKAYVEHVFHEGVVFRAGPDGYEGLLGGRRLLAITARGGDYRSGSPIARFDMLEPYLRGLFEYCGIAPDAIDIVNVHGTFAEPAEREAALHEARQRLVDLAARW